MVEEASLEFRLRKIDETRTYLLDLTKHNDLISEKYKETWECLNYVEHMIIPASTIAGSISVSAFASLVSVPIGVTSSTVGLSVCTITAGIKKCKWIIKKRRKSLIKYYC